jgi:hypothetical protein
MTIKVSLDTSVTPPVVTVHPNPFNVNNGNETIKWVPAAQQNFTFYSLTIPDPPQANSPFGTPQITSLEITVTDNNGSPNAVPYPYQICVTDNVSGATYCSAGAGIAGGGGGQPSIKND